MNFVHGGNVRQIALESGVAAGTILDFSSNINPLGLPPRAAERLAREAKEPGTWNQYPDPEYFELRSAISHYAGVKSASIAIGSGADALIHAAVRALRPRRCLISHPAFCEYERAAIASGSECVDASLDTAQHGDLVILNNPHNPTGTCLDRETVRTQIATARQNSANVLIDEAFIDYVPGASVTPKMAFEENVIVIRSLTKFFGCPGLRAGYAVAGPETLARLTAQLPPWPVTTLAANALTEALQDSTYIASAIETNAAARQHLNAELSSLGCCIGPSAANFLLIRVPQHHDAIAIRKLLITNDSILVRDCSSFQGLDPKRYLRIAVRNQQDNERLREALARILK